MPTRNSDAGQVSRLEGLKDEETVEFTVILRRANDDLPDPDTIGETLPAQRKYMTRAEFGDRFGAAAEDIARISAALEAEGFDIRDVSLPRRSLQVVGSAKHVNRFFGVELHACEGSSGRFRAHDDDLKLPDSLAGCVEAVLGVDTRPVARLHAGGPPAPKPYTASQLAERYNFPPGDGAGQTIGIISLAGGFDHSDLDAYFAALKLPVPEIVRVKVDGGCEEPSLVGRMETTLDIEVAGAVVPGARLVVYETPDNSSRSVYNALSTAIHDDTHRPSVISCSFGGIEEKWQDHDIEVTWSRVGLHQVAKLLAQDAVCLGVSFLAASGDYGSSVSIRGGYFSDIALVDFPASSPYALGCGGTLLTDEGEVAWNELASRAMDPQGRVRNGGATSGGTSLIFPRPSFQQNAGIDRATDGGRGRGVPDLSAHAASSPGYFVVLGGEQTSVGGTSAATPLIAGLLVRINAELGTPVGFLNPLLYRFQVDENRKVCRQVSDGCNGAFRVHADRPWNACTGLGAPDGMQLLRALGGLDREG